MTLAAAESACLRFDPFSIADLIITAVILGVPIAAIAVIARIARRNPTVALLRQGRRRGGVRLQRVGLAVTILGLLAFAIGVGASAASPQECEPASAIVAVIGLLLALFGAVAAGAGWAYALRAGWVSMAVVLVLDLFILLINVVEIFLTPETFDLLMVLAFATHAACSGVASRWAFNARQLGPLERARAGEAGRALAAVWVFLASYAVVSAVAPVESTTEAAAGAAVLGALSLGALAITMGSGYTHYAEAMHLPPNDSHDGTRSGLPSAGGISRPRPARVADGRPPAGGGIAIPPRKPQRAASTPPMGETTGTSGSDEGGETENEQQRG